MEFRVFIINMDAFNACTAEDKNATDFGAWFDLPIPTHKLGKEICETIGSVTTSTGYALTEAVTSLDELCYDSQDIWQANLDAIELSDYTLDDREKFIVNACLSEMGDDLETALDRMQRGVVYDDCEDEVALGKCIAEQEYMAIDSELEEYVRWEDFVYDRFYGDYIFYEYSCVVFL